MVRYSLEDIIDHFHYEGVNLNRTQLRSLMDLFEPDTGELISLDPEHKDWVAEHLFNKNEYNRYRKDKSNNYLFAELATRAYY